MLHGDFHLFFFVLYCVLRSDEQRRGGKQPRGGRSDLAAGSGGCLSTATAQATSRSQPPSQLSRLGKETCAVKDIHHERAFHSGTVSKQSIKL